MKGIILAGGSGTRLHPLTRPTSKQLLPIYDKPMIYYPLSVLMLAGLREILLISTPAAIGAYQRVLGDGSGLGLDIRYAVQHEPRGIAEAFVIGAAFLDGDQVALILGDNLFYGADFSTLLATARSELVGCTLFGYPINDPRRYGVAEVDDRGRLLSIEEKPAQPRSNRAVTGLYLYDSDVVQLARDLRPSARGELEITDLSARYITAGRARLVDLGRGFAWIDAGTPESFLEASEYVHILEHSQGVRIACIEEVALRGGFITAEDCYRRAERMPPSSYRRYVMQVAAASHARPAAVP